MLRGVTKRDNDSSPVKRDIYTGKEYTILSGKPRRFMPKMPVPYPIYDYYDYKTAIKLQHFKDINPETPKAVIFDIETTSLDPKEGVITSISWMYNDSDGEFYSLNKDPQCRETANEHERDCLEAFVKHIRKNKALSIIGFNSNFFDIPYLEHRCKMNDVPFDSRQYILQDVMQIANKLFIFGSLDNIAQQLGVERKLEVDNPVTLWKTKQYDTLIDYNVQDVNVTNQVYEKLEMSNFMEALWNLTWFDYGKIGANSHIVNMFYNKRMWEDGHCVSTADLKYKGDFGGGYNFDTQGVYENVYVFDFASLYPNIIRGSNLSPENYPEDTIRYSTDINANLVIKQEAFQNVKPGMLDHYITELLELRKEFKAEGKDHEQVATKILANSVYGILSQKTAKFFLGGTHLGATVTWIGRNILTTLARLIKHEGITTVYGKTDSIFVNSPFGIDETKEIMQRNVDKAWKLVTGTDNTTLSMDFEGTYTKLWIINKNNYCFIKNGNIYTKGASFRNTRNSQFEKDVTDLILKLVLEEDYKFKAEIRPKVMEFIAQKIATEPISYFAIKHKAREKKINLWDTGDKYMLHNDLGKPEFGFYHYVCKVTSINTDQPFEIIMFPLRHEPKGGFMVNRKWLEGQVEKILKKLDIEEKSKQISLSCFMAR